MLLDGLIHGWVDRWLINGCMVFIYIELEPSYIYIIDGGLIRATVLNVGMGISKEF